MKTTKRKHLLKTIRKSSVSFFAVAFIAAVSIAIFQGFQSASKAILEATDRYFVQNELETMEVACANGITPEDIQAIADWEGVQSVEGGYAVPLLLRSGEERISVQTRSLLTHVNKPVVLEGELPDAPDELAIEELMAKRKGLKVGDSVTIEHQGELVAEQFTITAIINEPSFCCATVKDARGKGSVGLGSNDFYVTLPLAAFDAAHFDGCFTTAYIDSSVLDGVYYFSDEYRTLEAAYLARLDGGAQERARLRYEALRSEAEAMLAQAQLPAAEAAAILETIQPREWVLSGRNDVGDVRGVQTIVDMLTGLSYVMSLIFLLVSIVICYAAVARMIDEQRTLIGAQKALGFTSGEILSHYMTYSLLCALLGIVLGWVLGVAVVETMILFAFRTELLLSSTALAFSIDSALIAAVIALMIFMGATYATCIKLSRMPAIALLRGEVASYGKKRFFENWGVYKRMDLYSRTMVKNVLNDKSRMLTTIMGVVGCVALLVSCISMKMGIENSSIRQFDEYFHYTHRMVIDTGVGDVQSFEHVLEEEGVAYTRIHDKLENFRVDGGSWENAHLLAIEDAGNISPFMRLEDVNTRQEIAVPEDGVLVSLRCAERFGLSEGSVVEFMDDKGQVRTFRIAGVMEHYLNYHLFVTSTAYYAEAMGKAPDRCVFLLKGELAGLPERISGMEGVLSLNDNSDFATNADVFDLVIAICTALSVALALLVLLNQITMYISRKARELAVMRINGYTCAETRAYIYKDNIVLTVVGLVLGCVVGCGLGYLDIRIIETGACRYVREPNFLACVIACAIVAVFALVVNLMALRRVKKLNLTNVSSN